MNFAQNSNGYKKRSYGVIIKQTILIAFLIAALAIMYKLTGFLVIGIIAGFCALFSPMFLTEPATYGLSGRSRTNDVGKSPIKRIVLIVFFIAALAIMYILTGFLVIGIIAGFCALFSPLFLTKPSRIQARTDMYTDPNYKGFSGNFFNDKK